MLKIYRILLTLTVAPVFLANSALALSPSYLAPSSSSFYLEIDSSKDHPFKGKIKNLVDEKSLTPETLPLWKALSPYLDNTTIGLSQSIQQNSIQDALISIKLSESAFSQLIESMGKNIYLKTTVNNHKIYLLSNSTFNQNSYLSYADGNLIASSNLENLSNLLLEKNLHSISDHADYKFLLSKSHPDSFLKSFINFQSFLDSKTLNSNWLKSQGLSLYQNANSLNGVFIVAPSPDFSIDMNKFNFIPQLYQQINPQNLLFYSETFNLRGHLEESFKMINTNQIAPGFNDFAKEITQNLEKESGLTWEKDLSPLFEGRSALAIHSEVDQQYYPAISFISDVSTQTVAAKQVLATLKNKLATQEEKGKLVFQINTLNTANGSFDLYTFNTIQNNSEISSTTKENPKEVFHLAAGITSDGKMVISTFSDPQKLFSISGLNNDSNWQKNFISESVLEVYYLNFPNLKNYLLELGKQLEIGSIFTDGVENLLGAFQAFYGKSRSEQGYIFSQFSLGVDNTKIDKLVNFIEEFQKNYPKQSEYLNQDASYYNQANQFTDIKDNDWFADDVFNLNSYYIMKGYGTEFKPHQNITRAEFVKTLMAANENYLGTIYTAVEPQQYFNDVANDTWYAPYVNKARAHYVINGYIDNTFHPHAPITRAEAVKILTNSSPSNFNSIEPNTSLSNHPFSDVKSTDWFYDSVYSAYQAQIVKGRSSSKFAPNDLLTRAEAAALINRYINLPTGFLTRQL